MPHTLALRSMEAAFLGLALWLLARLSGDVVAGAIDFQAYWLIPATLAAGIVCADFATGVIHWIGDRFFAADTPVLGPMLIRPFRDHHTDPQDITRHGLLELNGNNALPIAALLIARELLQWANFGTGNGFAAAAFAQWLFFFLAAALATNQFHQWAHARSVPRAVRWLQRRGVILPPERHARHHAGNFTTSYCITSGVLNPLLDRADFFGRCERSIRALRVGSR